MNEGLYGRKERNGGKSEKKNERKNEGKESKGKEGKGILS